MSSSLYSHLGRHHELDQELGRSVQNQQTLLEHGIRHMHAAW